LPGIVARLEPVAINTAKFDLSLSLSERRAPDGRPEGIERPIEYRTDLFERSSVEAVGRRLAALLEAAAADPGQPIGRIELLTPEERRQILVEWNDTARDLPQATLPALFEAQVGAVLKQSRCSLSRARAPHELPTGRVLLCADAGGIGAPMCDQLSRNWRHNTLNTNELYEKRLYHLRVEVPNASSLHKSQGRRYL
jgi:hypothetical protein